MLIDVLRRYMQNVYEGDNESVTADIGLTKLPLGTMELQIRKMLKNQTIERLQKYEITDICIVENFSESQLRKRHEIKLKYNIQERK